MLIHLDANVLELEEGVLGQVAQVARLELVLAFGPIGRKAPEGPAPIVSCHGFAVMVGVRSAKSSELLEGLRQFACPAFALYPITRPLLHSLTHGLIWARGVCSADAAEDLVLFRRWRFIAFGKPVGHLGVILKGLLDPIT